MRTRCGNVKASERTNQFNVSKDTQILSNLKRPTARRQKTFPQGVDPQNMILPAQIHVVQQVGGWNYRGPRLALVDAKLTSP